MNFLKNILFFMVLCKLLGEYSFSDTPKTEKDGHCQHMEINIENKKRHLCLLNYNAVKTNIISSNTEVIIQNKYNSNIQTTYFLKNIYFTSGYVMSKPFSSSIDGYIINNTFFGKIYIDSKTYYIENSVWKNIDDSEFQMCENTCNKTLPRTDFFKFDNYEKIGRNCPLLILLDTTFVERVGGGSLTDSELIILHSLHETNTIFRSTDFDNDGVPDNIGFTVKYFLILKYPDTFDSTFGRSLLNQIDGEQYLHVFSRQSLLKHVCLGVAFTARPFSGKAIGLSFTAITENSANPNVIHVGGICDRGNNRGSTFNVLVVTYVSSDGFLIPYHTGNFAFAHELGHSFGALHDYGQECEYYLMSRKALEGDRLSNYLFSECSKSRIQHVLRTKGYCLEEIEKSFCGNGLVENNEDCDCGVTANCIQNDVCCVPPSSPNGCRVSKHSDCHPSQGECCTSKCTFKDLSHKGIDCKQEKYKCPCSRKNCKCGHFSECIGSECHSIECTRIGLRECSYGQKHNSKCRTYCLSQGNICVSAQEVTSTVIESNETFKNLLKIRNDSLYNVSWETYCKNNTCITLPFREWDDADICVLYGKLGKCAQGTCKHRRSLAFRYPVMKRGILIVNRSSMIGCYFKLVLYVIIYLLK